MSSSAQLTLVPGLLGWDPPGDPTGFAAVLHAGSCAGVAWGLRDELRELSPTELWVLVGSAIPAATAGFLAADEADRRLGTPVRTAVLLGGAGLLLCLVDRRRPADRQVGGIAAAAAAVAQIAGLAPGVSRTGATLTALRLLRVDRAAAQRFSLLMSLPITAGAAGLTVLRSREQLPPALLPAVASAAVSAAAASRLVQRHGRAPVTCSALYRLAIAAAVVVRHQRGRA